MTPPRPSLTLPSPSDSSPPPSATVPPSPPAAPACMKTQPKRRSGCGPDAVHSPPAPGSPLPAQASTASPNLRGAQPRRHPPPHPPPPLTCARGAQQEPVPRPDVRLQLPPRRLPTERALGQPLGEIGGRAAAAGARRPRLRVSSLDVPAELVTARSGGGAAERAAGLAAQVRPPPVPPPRRLRGQRLPAEIAGQHRCSAAACHLPRGNETVALPASHPAPPHRCLPGSVVSPPGAGTCAGAEPAGNGGGPPPPPSLPGQCGARRGGVRHLELRTAAGAALRSGAAWGFLPWRAAGAVRLRFDG